MAEAASGAGGAGAGSGAEAGATAVAGDSITGGDIAQVQNLLNRVMLALDDGDGDAMAACFTPDGTIDVVMPGVHKAGTGAVAGLCRALHKRFATCRHWEGNVCVTASAGGCTNVSYWKAMDGGECVSTGIHRDNLVKVADGTWRLQSRVIEHTWVRGKGHIAPADAKSAAGEDAAASE